MNNSIKIYLSGLCLALSLGACTDTWNEHYDDAPATAGTANGSLWEAIAADDNLSNFRSVLEATGYDVKLKSSQVFTVFAPTNDQFSQADAQAVIAQYNAEKGVVADDENGAIKEFIQNHIALFNHSVSSVSSDTVRMMNGKYMHLTGTGIEGHQFLGTGTDKPFGHYGNGVLYRLGEKITYFPNVFEYMNKDEDLSGVASFLYDSRFYYPEFQEEESMPGPIVDGRTTYLDSVFQQRNELFDQLNARLSTEDSTYWMIVPNNAEWERLIAEYDTYFNYHDKVLPTQEERDSLHYMMTRLGVLSGTAFSRTTLTDRMLAGDSAMSTNAVHNYNSRESFWGHSKYHYYQYNNASEIFAGTTDVTCSNGLVKKSSAWPIDKKETFFQTRIIQAERGNSVRDLGYYIDEKKDSVVSTMTSQETVPANTPYYDIISNHRFLLVRPTKDSENPSVTFNISDVLSNLPYDIYIVMAPAIAADTNAVATDRLPTRIRCTLYQLQQNGSEKLFTQASGLEGPGFELGEWETTQDTIDVFRISPEEGITFDVCSYGLQTEATDAQVRLKVETNVTARERRRETHQRVMRIDCIVLVPHGTPQEEIWY